jgi:hypothetical protein
MYIAEFFLELEMFQTNVQKIKTHILFNKFFWKLCRLWEFGKIMVRVGQATGDDIIGRMRIVCCIPKNTDTHSEYVIIIAFPR